MMESNRQTTTTTWMLEYTSSRFQLSLIYLLCSIASKQILGALNRNHFQASPSSITTTKNTWSFSIFFFTKKNCASFVLRAGTRSQFQQLNVVPTPLLMRVLRKFTVYSVHQNVEWAIIWILNPLNSELWKQQCTGTVVVWLSRL